nr:LysR substrate-binding domain-containing protein [Neomegalonema perideroedes]
MEMDWDKLRVFHAVAAAGSLTQAGEKLHLSQSAVSRQIRDLEDSLGATLFHRHARGLLLTQEGEALYESTQNISADLARARARIRAAREESGGELAVSTTVGFGSLWLAPRLGRLRAAAPELTLDLRLSDEVVDLAMREADVGIRMRPSPQTDLIQKPLLSVRLRLYATEAYLKGRSRPRTLDDLADHDVLTYSRNAAQPLENLDWIYRGRRRIRPVLTVNNHLGLLQAAREGVGVAALPDYLAALAPELIPVGEEAPGPKYEIYLAWPQELRGSQRVALFRDFLLEELAAHRKTYPPDPF